MVMLLLLARDLLVCSLSSIVSGLSARLGQLDGWFRSWVPDSDLHLFVADVIQSFGTKVWIGF